MTADLTFQTALCPNFPDFRERAQDRLVSGWQPRPTSTPWHVHDGDWLGDPDDDRNWRFQLHAWRPLEIFVTAHCRTDDPEWLVAAARLMVRWHDAERMSGEGHRALFWNDMGTGLRAAKLAYVWQMLPRIQDDHPELVTPLEALVERHAAELLDERTWSRMNHGFFQAHGLRSLYHAHPRAAWGQAAFDASRALLTDLVERQFAADGMHLEHSPGYHLFTMRILERLTKTGWYADVPSVIGAVSRAQDALPWIVHPDRSLIGFGDTDRTVLDAKRLGKSAAQGGRLFPDAGLAVVRGGGDGPDASVLAVTGAHHSHIHKHADDLSFELYEQGRLWFSDTGKHSYNRGAWTEFTSRASAHNTVEFLIRRADNGLKKTDPTGGLIQSLDEVDGAWTIEAGYRREKVGITHRRTFLYRPKRSLIIDDAFSSEAPVAKRHWLHLAPGLTAERTSTGWKVGPMSIDYEMDDTTLLLSSLSGQKEPDIQGWHASAYEQLVARQSLCLEVMGTTHVLRTTIRFQLSDPDGGLAADEVEAGVLPSAEAVA